MPYLGINCGKNMMLRRGNKGNRMEKQLATLVQALMKHSLLKWHPEMYQSFGAVKEW